MLEAQQKMMSHFHKQQFENAESVKIFYEKQLADKTYLINELLKKVKELTTQLAEIKAEKAVNGVNVDNSEKVDKVNKEVNMENSEINIL
jgi:ribosomal protein L29